ncbi:winged helix-turn-helix transcriptional regulator [Sphingopyxis yananensis]|uniref:winged helix-turn-helix transcriptional regulator n=1 Tax=Sphingopyxis yananensis TaxID=2886687 RepID=UPI001D0FE84B|nr:helix-turn-helix domain-containing protein [Sphingopyxis yananensis]
MVPNDLWEDRMLQDVYPKLTLEIMDLVGNKWTLLLVYQLAERTQRFSELRRNMAPISQKMLTQKLRELERYGMVDRFVWPSTPPKVEYALTDLGRSFLGAASVICDWTRGNVEELAAARASFDAAAQEALSAA